MKPLRPDAELTFNLVVQNAELFQIDEVTERRGKAAYRKNGDCQHKNYPLRPGTTNLPSSSMLYNSNFLSFVKTATSDVIVPPNLLPPRESSSRLGCCGG